MTTFSRTIARTEPTRSTTPRPEIRTISDLLRMLLDVADSHDLGVIDSTVSHKGLTIILPDGFVRLHLEYGSHVPLTTPDPAPSDQYPAIAETDGTSSIRLSDATGWGDDHRTLQPPERAGCGFTAGSWTDRQFEAELVGERAIDPND